MKQLKFEHDFAQDIIRGSRRTTIRIDDKQVQLGELVQIVDKTSTNKPQLWEIPGEIRITGRQEFLLRDVPLELLRDSELGVATRDELYGFLRRFYGERIGEESVISLFNFDYQPYAQPVPYLLSAKMDTNSSTPSKVFLYADGGSRGNPGPSASGYVITDEQGNVVETWNKYLGMTTNNQAEYHGLIAGLEWCKQHDAQDIHVRLDSLLVVNQMNGQFKVKNRELWALYEAAKKLQASFKKITFTHIPRELNQLADAEVNKALDAIKSADVVQ